MNDRKYWCAHLSNYMVLLCEIIQLKFDFRKEYRQQTIQNFSKLFKNWIRNMIRLNSWYSITTNKIKYRKESIFSQLIYIYMYEPYKGGCSSRRGESCSIFDRRWIRFHFLPKARFLPPHLWRNILRGEIPRFIFPRELCAFLLASPFVAHHPIFQTISKLLNR